MSGKIDIGIINLDPASRELLAQKVGGATHLRRDRKAILFLSF